MIIGILTGVCKLVAYSSSLILSFFLILLKKILLLINLAILHVVIWSLIAIELELYFLIPSSNNDILFIFIIWQ